MSATLNFVSRMLQEDFDSDYLIISFEVVVERYVVANKLKESTIVILYGIKTSHRIDYSHIDHTNLIFTTLNCARSERQTSDFR